MDEEVKRLDRIKELVKVLPGRVGPSMNALIGLAIGSIVMSNTAGISKDSILEGILVRFWIKLE